MRRNTVIAFVSGVGVAALAAIPAVAAAPSATPGTATSPKIVIAVPGFKVGGTLDSATARCGDGTLYNLVVPMKLSWSATSGSAPVAGFDIYVQDIFAADGSDRTIVVADTTATSLDVIGSLYDNDCGGEQWPDSYDIVAKTGLGFPRFVATASVYTSRLIPNVWQEDGTPEAHAGTLTLAKTGTWSTSSCTCFNGGATSWTTSAGASMSFTVQTSVAGQYVALVMPEATNRGKATMTIDGNAAGTVDTFAATSLNRVIVWQGKLGAAGKHTVKVMNQATAGRPRIDIDSILMSNPAW